jgi:hypothetical protein
VVITTPFKDYYITYFDQTKYTYGPPPCENLVVSRVWLGKRAQKVRAFSHTSILSVRAALLNSGSNSCLLKRKIIKMEFYGKKINLF